MRRYSILLLSFLLVFIGKTGFVTAQAPQSWTSAEMYLAMKKLNVLGSVLYIAAHPDDENTRLITYLSKDKLYRTGYLSLTRGDGGQNLIGNEQGVELGLIRTQELLAARRMDGGEQFFSRAYDFGFSKNPQETFTKWDKEKILSDVVWVIRQFQPDVIITRFPTTGEGGHGHHTASAILANEAFTAAADPNRFPEQLKYVKPWQAKRIFFNSFNFGGTSTITEDQMRIDVGGYNPLLGKSYGEIAATSRSNHKSQGFGSAASRGESFESFKLTGGNPATTDIMDGVEQGWQRVPGSVAIAKDIDQLTSSFDLMHPENSVKGLVDIYNRVKLIPDGYWKTQKLKEVQELIAQCSGLFLDATTVEQYAVQSDSIKINFSFNNRLGTDAFIEGINIDGKDSAIAQPLGKNKNLTFSIIVNVPLTKKISQPYWLENKMAEGYFNVSDPVKIGQPDVDPAYQAMIRVKIYGQTFTFLNSIKYKFTDPVKGEVYEPLIVVPPVTVRPSLNLAVTTDKKPVQVDMLVHAYRTIDLTDTLGGAAKGPEPMKRIKVGNFVKGQEQFFPEAVPVGATATTVRFYVGNSKEPNYKNKHEIRYDHIPYINYFTEAEVTSLNLDLKIYNKRIGYIVGAGDKVPQALEQMGYEVVLLGDKELSRNNLQQYDAIITGVRAYNTNDWMNNYYDKLMRYVNDGGNLIVQYNTSTNSGGIKAKLGPYNFDIARGTRVTDENAEMRILKPQHPVLNFPNKITPDDFKGWIQERSIYHASGWDKNFETIFSMNDPGERPDEGSLIISKYGKGYFTYTGIVFFRELPAGIPGAYRLIANIIALNKKKAF